MGKRKAAKRAAWAAARREWRFWAAAAAALALWIIYEKLEVWHVL